MQRIQSCSFKQVRWINKWCLKKRTDSISKTVYYLVYHQPKRVYNTSLFLVKPTLLPSLYIFFMNTKPQTGKKCWERGLMCESKVDFFPVFYPSLFYAVSCLHYMTQSLLLVWSSWVLESCFRRSIAGIVYIAQRYCLDTYLIHFLV